MEEQLRECAIHGRTVYVKRPSQNHWRCRKCETLHVRNRRRRLRQEIITLAGGKCQRCGYDKCQRALSFHHRDKSKKSFRLSVDSLRGKGAILEEVAKCDLLCANCHMEVEDALMRGSLRAKPAPDKRVSDGSIPSPSTISATDGGSSPSG